MAKVSIIVAVYNGAATIDRELRSIFAQTFTDSEVVVVNDGSTDDTASVLARHSDRIRVITQPNRGLSAARNAGVRGSAGEYVAFLDDDDEWMPDMRGVPLGQDVRPADAESPTMKELLARPWNVVPSQFVVRRDVFERCGGSTNDS